MPSKNKYPCKHCGTKWSELYLAELCFKVDMENLEKQGTGKVLIPIEEYKQRQKSNESAKQKEIRSNKNKT